MPIYGNIRKFKFDLILTEERVFEPLSNDLINLVKKSLLEIIEEVFPLNWQIDTAIYMNKNIQKYVVEPPLITSEPSTAENSDIQFWK